MPDLTQRHAPPVDCGRSHPQPFCLCIECENAFVNEAFNEWRPAGKHPAFTLDRARIRSEDGRKRVIVKCADCGGEWDVLRDTRTGAIEFIGSIDPAIPECLS